MNEIVTIANQTLTATNAHTDTQLIDLFLRGKKSGNTKATYTTALEQFFAFTNCPLEQLKLDDMQDYADHLTATYDSAHTRKLKLNAVKSLLTFGTKVGYLRFNVGAAIEADKAESIVEDKVLDEDVVLTLLATVTHQRDNLLIRLLYATGGRVSEICGLTWADVQDGYVILRNTKSGKPRRVGISDKTMNQLRMFRTIDATDGAPVFTVKYAGQVKPMDRFAVDKVLKAIAKAHNLPRLSAHMFRHSHATHAIKRGAKINTVRDTLGHSSIAVTNTYAHASGLESSGDVLAV